VDKWRPLASFDALSALGKKGMGFSEVEHFMCSEADARLFLT
jgi:hypothetical protein